MRVSFPLSIMALGSAGKKERGKARLRLGHPAPLRTGEGGGKKKKGRKGKEEFLLRL